MRRHTCKPGCLVCAAAIDRREFADERGWDDPGGQDAYEKYLDRIGGSA